MSGQFHAPATLPPSNMRLGRHQRRSLNMGGRKNIFALSRIEVLFLVFFGRLFRVLVTTDCATQARPAKCYESKYYCLVVVVVVITTAKQRALFHSTLV